jgi:hypothetical protein
MKMLIKRIEEDQAGRLLVIPETADNYGFQFIYRAENGLRWELSCVVCRPVVYHKYF